MQNLAHEIDPQQRRSQSFLCLFGPLVMVLGFGLTVIGMISYFSSLSSLEPPSYLWGLMVGLPLLGVGASFTRLGQHGEILQDLNEEVSPVTNDPAHPWGQGTRRGVGTIAHAVGCGLMPAMTGVDLSESETILCGRCDAINPAHARFCNQCGTSLLDQTCAECGANIAPTARFCNQCGKLVG